MKQNQQKEAKIFLNVSICSISYMFRAHKYPTNNRLELQKSTSQSSSFLQLPNILKGRKKSTKKACQSLQTSKERVHFSMHAIAMD